MNTFRTNQKMLQERLREAASFGDIETLQEILTMGVDIDSKNDVNGWTALHWAAYRNNPKIVDLLLKYGADKTITTKNGELAYDLATTKEVQLLLNDVATPKDQILLPFIPNYLKNPPLQLSSCNSLTLRNTTNDYDSSRIATSSEEELVLKLRIANSAETDFIEVELPKTELTFSKLIEICCTELEINSSSIYKIRKLPNTILRKDKDIQRLKDFQEIEVVLQGSNVSISTTSPLVKSNTLPIPVNRNQYESISLKKNQTVLY